MKDWEEMVQFAIRLIKHSFEHSHGDIIDQRIMIHNLDHAFELLMKAYLLKKRFVIDYLDKGKIIKKEDFLKESKSLEYSVCLDFIVKELVGKEKKKIVKDRILYFHGIRNEIQHRAIYLPDNKENEIRIVYPYFKELYMIMFGDRMDIFPHLPENI
jgi:hypothetical protein